MAGQVELVQDHVCFTLGSSCPAFPGGTNRSKACGLSTPCLRTVLQL